MSTDKVLIGKAIISLGAFFLGLVLLRKSGLLTMSLRRFQVVSVVILLFSRVLVFSVPFILLGLEAQSDVAGVYYPQAKAALAGRIPYRDFDSSYAPFFSHVASAAVAIWDSPKSIMLLAILFEAAAFPIWIWATTKTFGARPARLAALFYLASALPLINVAIDGQNQVWAAFFLAAAFAFLATGMPAASGVMFSLPLIVVKFLPAIFGPAFLLGARRKLSWLIGAGVLPVVIYGVLVGRGIDIMLPFRAEGADATSGNLLFLLGPILPTAGKSFLVLVPPLALAAAYLLFWRYFRTSSNERMVMLAILLIELVLLLTSKKAYTNYLAIVFFPLCLSVVASSSSVRRSFVWFSIFSTVAVVEPTLWFRWLGRQSLSVAWSGLAKGAGPTAGFFAFVVLDLVLLTFYFFYARSAWTLFRQYAHETNVSPKQAME